MIEQFPKRCIKCKRSDVELVAFSITKTKSSRLDYITSSWSSRTAQARIPVCKSCKIQFINYRRFKKVVNLFKNLFIGFLILTIIFFFIQGWDEILNSIFTIFIFLSVGFFVIFVFLYVNDLNHPNRISNYVSLEIGRSGTKLIFKDPEYLQNMVDHAASTFIEEEVRKELGIDIIYCPKCGSKQMRDVDFCLQCGKELRRIKNC